MTLIALSPLVDRSGTVLHDAAGVPLAADGDGLVYTMTSHGGPTPLGELAEDAAGRVVLVPLGAIDPEDKGHRLARLGRKRAHLRGRLAHHEGRVQRLTAAGVAATDPRMDKHTGRVETLKAELAAVQTELEQANAEPLNGLADLAEDGDDLQGLGSFRKFWNKNKKIIGGVAAGAAGAALVGSAMNPNSGLGKGVRAVPGALKNFFVGSRDAGSSAAAPATAEPAAMLPATASAGSGPSFGVAPGLAIPATYEAPRSGGIPMWAILAGAAAVGFFLLKKQRAA